MAINYFGEARMKQLLTLIKGQLDLKATPAQIAQAITDANLSQYALAADLTGAVSRIGANETDIATIKETLKSVATTEGLEALTADVNTIKGDYLKAADKTELEGKITAAVKAHDESDAAHATLFKALNDKDTELKTAIDGEVTRAKAEETKNATAASDAKTAADAAQADVDALEAKVGTVAEDKTVVQMIADAQTAATYDDTDIKSRMTTVEGKVTTLVGDDASKSARSIAAEEVAKVVAGADASFDTLKEIADWISGHKTDAAAMNSAILALEAIVDGIGGDGEKATVVAYVQDAIDALKISDYAKAADLTALASRVGTLEGKSHEHANKTVLDSITQEMVDAWNTADTEYTEAEVTAMWNSVFTAQA